MSRAVVVLARAPSADGKTRLTSGMAPGVARALREALLLDTLDVVRELDIPIALSFTPASARTEILQLAPDVQLVEQCDGDLGARMHHAIIGACQPGVRAVVLVGSDLPTLPAAHVKQAFEMLDAGRDIVIGPTDDGGYYLIGCRCGVEIDSLFTGIAWGSREVLAQTRAAAQRVGLDTAMLLEWFDVDAAEDLVLIAEYPRPFSAERTRAWYRTHTDGSQ